MKNKTHTPKPGHAANQETEAALDVPSVPCSRSSEPLSNSEKQMKAIILYAQETPSPEHQMMHVVREKDSTTLYVRAEIVDDDPDFALDKATPREGEIVLNSVPSPGENA